MRSGRASRAQLRRGFAVLRKLASVPPHLPADAADAALLDAAEPVAGSRVLVIGRGALETVCGLIRRGCTAATELADCDHAATEAESVETVVVPSVATMGEAQTAVAVATRALIQGGRIALCAPAGALRRHLPALLGAHGFAAVRAWPSPGGAVLTAERPMFGPLHRR
jgi:hypothetical protein